MSKERPTYLSYLLRLWQSSREQEEMWHASLTDPISGEHRGFGSLDALFGFVRRQMRDQDDSEIERGEETGPIA